jgi:hypothetical protein
MAIVTVDHSYFFLIGKYYYSYHLFKKKMRARENKGKPQKARDEGKPLPHSQDKARKQKQHYNTNTPRT